jgi:transposase
LGRKAKYSKEDKLKAVKEYNDGIKSYGQLGNELGCNWNTVRKWVMSYNTLGQYAFDDKPKNKSYSRELKLLAINDYLSGEGSLIDISKKYKILSESTLKNWVMKYNSHKEIKDYDPKGDVYMTKGTKTTFEDRLKIVKFCIENNRDYTQAAAHYNQPYSQVYQWVRKYDEKGKDGLIDGRGRNKQESELSETDKLKRDNEILQARIQRLEMENEVLKKLEEIERGLTSARSGKKRNT